MIFSERPFFITSIIMSFFLSLSKPKAKKPSSEILIFFLSINIFEPKVVFPIIKLPWENFPLNSAAVKKMLKEKT